MAGGYHVMHGRTTTKLAPNSVAGNPIGHTNGRRYPLVCGPRRSATRPPECDDGVLFSKKCNIFSNASQCVKRFTDVGTPDEPVYVKCVYTDHGRGAAAEPEPGGKSCDAWPAYYKAGTEFCGGESNRPLEWPPRRRI